MISVVLSNYNGQVYLAEAIDSVLNQTYKNYEVILIDDGSTDNSRAVLNKYKGHERVVLHFAEKNGGQCAGFNKGVELARGEWISFMDSDDLWFENKLEEVSKAIEKNQDCALIQHNLYIMRGEKPTQMKFTQELNEGDLYKEFLETERVISFIPTAGLTFRKEVLKKVVPIPQAFRVCADGFMTRTSMLYGEVVAINKSLGYYRVHENNNTFANEKFSNEKYLKNLLLPELRKYYYENGFLADFPKLIYYIDNVETTFVRLMKTNVVSELKLILKVFLAKLFLKFKSISYPFYFLMNRRLKDLINKAKISKLRAKHHGQRAFIIGMGPSLKTADLDLLTNDITFACNKIYLGFNDTRWRPTYYSVADVLVSELNQVEINTVKSDKIFMDCVKKDFEDRADITWIHNLAPIHTKDGQRIFKISEDLFRGAYGGFTVLYLQIQLAIYMGIKEIYLIGVDFSFDVSKSTGEDCEHGEVLENNGEVNHFHKDYRKDGEKWTYPRLDMQVKAFEAAKKFADERGIKIYNASRSTKLEVFEKVDFDDLF